jgi:hypothetical protein
MKRRALLCLLVPAGAVLARPALAWREQAADAAVAQSWADRCLGTGAKTFSGDLVICPFCGCPVIGGGRDHGEGGRLPAG